MSPDQERAEWTARLAMAYADVMTDADRLKLLNSFYDTARSQGVSEGIERLATRLTSPTLADTLLGNVFKKQAL